MKTDSSARSLSDDKKPPPVKLNYLGNLNLNDSRRKSGVKGFRRGINIGKSDKNEAELRLTQVELESTKDTLAQVQHELQLMTW